MSYSKTLLFRKSILVDAIGMEDYIQAVEAAHRQHGQGKTISTGILHGDAPRGEFHIKSGGLLSDASYFGVKINGGFFSNPSRLGIPSIVGVIYLACAESGYPLAVFESSVISRMRTGAATAVAAKYLRPKGPLRVGLVGYGRQAAAQLLALQRIGDLAEVRVSGRSHERATAFAAAANKLLGVEVQATTIADACRESNFVVTCTPSREALVQDVWIADGTTLAAVGADSPGKQELEPALMTRAKIVADIGSQAIAVGESQHASRLGLITKSDLHGELGDVVTGAVPGRSCEDEIFVYDSTGTALQDVAAAAFIYEKLRDKPGVEQVELFA